MLLKILQEKNTSNGRTWIIAVYVAVQIIQTSSEMFSMSQEKERN